MNEQTLLAYVLRELPAFRADMAAVPIISKVSVHSVAAGLRDVLRAADARRNAAGLTRSQAERACVLAAKA